MLMDYKGNVTVKIDGIAASAASVIAMAGTEVLMSPVSTMMIHNPATVAMDYPNNNTKHEKGKHLKYEDYVVIQVRLRDGWKANKIAGDIKLSPATVRRAIKDLKNAGLLNTTQRYREQGGKSSLLFRLN